MSLLHRLRPGAKLLGLLLFSVAVVVAPGWVSALVALGIGLLANLITRLPISRIARGLAKFAPVAVLLFAFQWWQHGPARATEVVADLIALILAAGAVTASTTVSDLLDTIIWALSPLQRFGVSPERTALAFSLALRSIPHALTIARDTQAAARARGLGRNPRAFAVPFVLRMVAHARDTGAAMHARGLGDESGAD